MTIAPTTVMIPAANQSRRLSVIAPLVAAMLPVVSLNGSVDRFFAEIPFDTG
jgi:hypothetical protein